MNINSNLFKITFPNFVTIHLLFQYYLTFTWNIPRMNCIRYPWYFICESQMTTYWPKTAVNLSNKCLLLDFKWKPLISYVKFMRYHNGKSTPLVSVWRNYLCFISCCGIRNFEYDTLSSFESLNVKTTIYWIVFDHETELVFRLYHHKSG